MTPQWRVPCPCAVPAFPQATGGLQTRILASQGRGGWEPLAQRKTLATSMCFSTAAAPRASPCKCFQTRALCPQPQPTFRCPCLVTRAATALSSTLAARLPLGALARPLFHTPRACIISTGLCPPTPPPRRSLRRPGMRSTEGWHGLPTPTPASRAFTALATPLPRCSVHRGFTAPLAAQHPLRARHGLAAARGPQIRSPPAPQR